MSKNVRRWAAFGVSLVLAGIAPAWGEADDERGVKYEVGNLSLNLMLDAAVGTYHAANTNFGLGTTSNDANGPRKGTRNWLEYFVKPSLGLEYDLQGSGVAYGLFSAIGAGNRGKAMDILDTLVREGEYLPMALTFVASQFKMALVAHEAGLRNSGQILGHFTKLGVRIWKSRADEVAQTVAAFPKAKTEKAKPLLFGADCEVRGTHVDDRTTFEMLILALTA